MTASSKSNGKILTPCHIDVNKKKCNSLDDVTGNGVTIRKTRKKDFPRLIIFIEFIFSLFLVDTVAPLCQNLPVS